MIKKSFSISSFKKAGLFLIALLVSYPLSIAMVLFVQNLLLRLFQAF